MLKAILRQACSELVEVAHNELSGSPPPLVVRPVEPLYEIVSNFKFISWMGQPW